MKEINWSKLDSEGVNDVVFIREQELRGSYGYVSQEMVINNRIRLVSSLLEKAGISKKNITSFINSPYIYNTGHGSDEEFNRYLAVLSERFVVKNHPDIEIERAYLNSLYKDIELNSEYFDYSESGLNVSPDKIAYYQKRIQDRRNLTNKLGLLLQLKRELERAKAAGEPTHALIGKIAELIVDIEEKTQSINEQEKEVSRKVA